MVDNNNNSNLTQELLKELAINRKSDRRWKNIRFFIVMGILFFYGMTFFTSRFTSKFSEGATYNDPYVALIRLNGEIMPGSDFSAENVIPLLTTAFSDKNARGVVLDINSPGGSPVQAGIIHDKIMAFKHQYPRKKVIVVGEDTLASGAYLVATAADKIYVNQDTLTGSIGVIMSSFGLDALINKVGVSRRAFTAGIHKNRLDAFMPLRAEDVLKVNTVLQAVHQDFINDVQLGRKGRLKATPDILYSGDFWTGSEAVKLGLADNTGNLWDVLDKEFEVKHFRDYSPEADLVSSLVKKLGTELHLQLEGPKWQMQ